MSQHTSDGSGHSPVDILILGAGEARFLQLHFARPETAQPHSKGWTADFLVPLLHDEKVSYASTTRDGRNGSIKFAFDPASDDARPFEALPAARCVLIVFPIYLSGGSERLVKLYRQTHMRVREVRFIQLGSTGIWDGGPTLAPTDEKKASSPWTDRHSPISTTNERALAEEELLTLHATKEGTLTTVLNLCGLWGGGRSMRRYVSRIAGTKEQLKNKGSIHMVHGIDVARAILATSRAPHKVFGQRWLVTGRLACTYGLRLWLSRSASRPPRLRLVGPGIQVWRRRRRRCWQAGKWASATMGRRAHA